MERTGKQGRGEVLIRDGRSRKPAGGAGWTALCLGVREWRLEVGRAAGSSNLEWKCLLLLLLLLLHVPVAGTAGAGAGSSSAAASAAPSTAAVPAVPAVPAWRASITCCTSASEFAAAAACLACRSRARRATVPASPRSESTVSAGFSPAPGGGEGRSYTTSPSAPAAVGKLAALAR